MVQERSSAAVGFTLFASVMLILAGVFQVMGGLSGLIKDDSTIYAGTADNTYAFSLDTTTLSAGVHQLQARAIDPAGNVGFSPGVSVTIDNVAPTVSITSPASGATVTGNVTITANASDATSGVASVSFFVDGSSIGTDPNSPYSAVWNTAGVTPGSHILQARALDRAGNQGLSANVTVTVPQGACAGLCANPTIFTINGSFQSGPLGTGATCFQTTSVVHSGFCQNFVSPRTLSVNGTIEPCNGANWPSVPAARNGGYCVQTTAGNQSTASFPGF